MTDHQKTPLGHVWISNRFAAFLICMGVAMIASPSAFADKFASVGAGWQRYSNDLYGTEFEFPANLFTAAPAPASGDSRYFTSADANLEIFATPNIGRETARTLRRRLLQDEQGYDDVTYAPIGENWLVLSGFRGAKIFYEKYLLRDGIIHAFGMEFPSSAKPIYAPIIERIEDSFGPGAQSSTALTRASPSTGPAQGRRGREAQDPLVIY